MFILYMKTENRVLLFYGGGGVFHHDNPPPPKEKGAGFNQTTSAFE